MDAQDFRSLQEAYLEVYYELDEDLTGVRKEKVKRITSTRTGGYGAFETNASLRRVAGLDKRHPSQGFGTISKTVASTGQSRAPKYAMAQRGQTKTQGVRVHGSSIGGGVGGRGMPLVDTLPRGKGSKAARRVAALTKTEPQKSSTNRLVRSDKQGIKDSYEYDVYDIIFSHLLDEGYASTPKAAKVIMVNMSEEWRGDIVELYKGRHGRSHDQRTTH